MKKQIILAILILFTSFTHQTAYVQTPYSISVEPETDTASPGEIKEFTIIITADPEFTDSGYIELEITALTYEETYYIGNFEPPYPAVIEYEFMVPEDIPGDVTAYGTVTAYSGDYVADTEVTLRIKSGGILGSIIGWVLSILNSIRQLFS